MVRVALSVVSVCVAFLGVLCIPPVQADQQEDIQVKDVVVSSTRLPDAPVDARTLPAKVTVITAEDIKKSGAKTVQEAIQWATGIVMYDQVGNAFQQTIDLRGFNGQPVPATSVFVDGMRMNEPDFNTVNFDLIPYETIERIEILPGPSAIYGKNALGGVINIITKRGGEKRQATGETVFGSFHRERYSLNTSGPIGKQVDYYANFSREIEDGFRNESDARISRFFGKLGYRPTDKTDVTVSYTYVKSRLLQAGTLPLSLAAIDRKTNFTPGDFNDHETSVVRLTGRYEITSGLSVNVNAFYRRLGQEQFTVGQFGQSDSLNKTESRGGTIQLTHEARPFDRRNTFVAGSESTRNDFSLRRDFPGAFPGLSSTDEDILGLYVQNTLHVTSQLILTGGVRYDHDQLGYSDGVAPINNSSKRFNFTTSRGGMTYLITPRSSAYFSYSEGFRVPTRDELFGQAGFGSNPDLRPAKSRNYEIGAKSGFGTWGEGAIALFQSDQRDEILFTCNICDFTDGQNRNVDRTRRRGVEATLKTKYGKFFDSVLNYTFTEAQFRTQHLLGATRLVQAGDSLPQVPKNRVSLTTNFHPADGWTVSLIGLYVSTQFHMNDEENTRPRLPGYFVLNSRIAYERPVPGGQLSGFLMVNNMLDQQYSTSGIIANNFLTGGGAQERFVMPAPGVAIYGGLSFKFAGF